MFERFTDRARRAIVLAQVEAHDLHHTYIGTEHLLLGIIAEGSGVAVKALEAIDVPIERVRADVIEVVGVGGGEVRDGTIPFTPRAKKVMEMALREALRLGHNYIGTEHLLLGLLREGEGIAAQVLHKLGADAERVADAIVQQLTRYGVESARTEPETPADPTTGRAPPRCPRCGAGLAANARWTELDVRGPGERAFAFVYCDVCGTNLGVTPL